MDSSNNVTKKFYRGYQLICDDKGKYYMHDPHGNVIETYKSGQTTRFEKYFYNAYGTQYGFDDTDLVEHNNEWGYCGQMYDNFTHNYYMRARDYNPAIGRFISEDPIKDGSNWYDYCYNNPIRFNDYLGLKPGDEFKSADDAAIDFANFANPSSIKYGVEYGTFIYSYEKEVTKKVQILGYTIEYTAKETKYSYIQPFTSNSPDYVKMNTQKHIDEINNLGGTYVASAHTHASAKAHIRKDADYTDRFVKAFWNQRLKDLDDVSDVDKSFAKKSENIGKNHYIVTPSGKVKKFGYSNGIFYNKYHESTIYNNAPKETYP